MMRNHADGMDHHDRELLQRLAHRAMLERGLWPDFSAPALAELEQFNAPAGPDGRATRDLRQLLWASIDNDDSRDLDQLTVAEALPDGRAKVLVAIADVDALVKRGSPIDDHAGHNTASVYTAAQIFPMLPETLSTDLTSLNYAQERLAIVVEIVVDAQGAVRQGQVYRGWVYNRAQLAYNQVAAWLEGETGLPGEIAAVPGLAENLRLQDQIAQKMMRLRHEEGALSLETIQARPRFEGDKIRDLEAEVENRAKTIVEDFMIAANGVTARFLAGKNFPSIRRVVRTPKRWERIVEIAAQYGADLPGDPDPATLEDFLTRQRAADPLRFPDLSLSIIKLLGAGEYVAALPGEAALGHFGLAVRDYGHSTAPNRRFVDLITQRLLKAAIVGGRPPYTRDELKALATHCTMQEDAINKVERQVGKSAAALLLQDRIGEQFKALVTGAAAKGTWVRLLSLPVEGKLVAGYQGVDVGDRLRVALESVDVERGFIDFRRVD